MTVWRVGRDEWSGDGKYIEGDIFKLDSEGSKNEMVCGKDATTENKGRSHA